MYEQLQQLERKLGKSALLARIVDVLYEQGQLSETLEAVTADLRMEQTALVVKPRTGGN